jgi:hypothetical protein
MRLVDAALGAVITVTAAVVLAGCTSNGHPAAQAPSSTDTDAAQTVAVHATQPACPEAVGPAPHLPSRVPQDLPLPAGARVGQVSTVAGTLQMRFTVGTSFKQAAKDLLAALPARGFTLAGGDAEIDEVDIPFTRGASQFNIKLHALADPCAAEGRLVVRVAG